ncbi:adaptor related protein complex 3 subunit beta 1 [Rhinolophus ferrumequinum]|uniref:Adaptor related protein complex 3 subunit beta 1 n=1 Tax=Rhinolophus ferrumequinum TaxID=59479 RepID=A0A7J7Y3U7_RHIFE|nr:adaptor related protein complex 3 subunit beta 1 [Rhinolophus ferrumequinum]
MVKLSNIWPNSWTASLFLWLEQVFFG